MRIGKVKISREVLKEITKLHSEGKLKDWDLLIVNIERDYDINIINVHGVCPRFDEVSDNEDIPRYNGRLELSEDGISTLCSLERIKE